MNDCDSNFFFRLSQKKTKLTNLRGLKLVSQWLHQDSNALELTKISGQIEFILLEYFIVSITLHPGAATNLNLD
jgi:hypothetical protein